jgi:GH18 family chitinase
LLSLFGRLTPVDGWALYESDDMGAAIRDAVKRANVVSQVANYVTARKMDGVDVVMTDFNGAANYGANLAALSPFVTELKAALPAGSIVTVTVTVGWQHWEYPDLSNADWVNVHAFENGANVGPGAPVGQQSPFSFMVDASNIWLNKLPANKIVVGFPVFGLRYNELDANGNNASWGSYDYLTYRDILAIDPTAHTKDYIDASKGVYYNGVALIQEKAEYIKNSQFKGMYGWYIDADATDSTKSLFKAVNEKLN